jgi:hypothetical protein
VVSMIIPSAAAAKVLQATVRGKTKTKGSNRCKASLEIPARAEQAVNTYLVKRHAALLRWLSLYFEAPLDLSAATPGTVRCDKLPVYFQHDGHSRTLVGFEARSFAGVSAPPTAATSIHCWATHLPEPHVAAGTKRIRPEPICALAGAIVDLTDDHGDSTEEEVPFATVVSRATTSHDEGHGIAMPGSPQINLLILDPATSAEALSNAVRTGKNWGKMVKRGLHTLRKPCYEIVYVDPTDELLIGAMLEDSKLVVEVHLVE